MLNKIFIIIRSLIGTPYISYVNWPAVCIITLLLRVLQHKFWMTLNNNNNNKWRLLHYLSPLLSSMWLICTINLVLNVIKSQRRYNNKTKTILWQALAHVLCGLVSTAVDLLKLAVADTGSSVQPLKYTYITIVPHVLQKYQFWSWSWKNYSNI